MLIQKNALSIWLKNTLPNYDYNIFKLAGDASFRQYYRITYEDQSRILMDSSFDKLAFQKFIDITNELTAWNLPAPKIYATNNSENFALLEDFGDNLLLDVVNQDNRAYLYKEALDILIKMQNFTDESKKAPAFNTALISQELNLFSDWFINKYLQLEFTNSEKQVVIKSFNLILDIMLSLPQAFSHMDYHSRNIIVLPNQKLGIIDYQDAKISPFTYDLVSLLKDCYIKLPQNFINEMLDYYYQNSHIAKELSVSEFVRAFNLCGLQRHIKVLGIFSRLHIRDNKARYLQDIPLVMHYTLDCLEQYNEFADFYEIMTAIKLNSKLSVC